MNAIIYIYVEKFDVEKKHHDFPVPQFSCNKRYRGLIIIIIIIIMIIEMRDIKRKRFEPPVSSFWRQSERG